MNRTEMPGPSHCELPLNLDQTTLTLLRELSQTYRTQGAVLGKLAMIDGLLASPKEPIHVISDVHGEFKKLKHVVNNASGSLRELVQHVLGSRVSGEEQQRLLNLIYYPRETWTALELGKVTSNDGGKTLTRLVEHEVALLRALVERHPIARAATVFPKEYAAVFTELVTYPADALANILDPLVRRFLDSGDALLLVRMLARSIRNLLISEVVVAGDLGDRGPRLDLVSDYLMRLPRVRVVWGNHDASWMGACLGSLVCIATVLRVSLRYSRLAQLEEGYGITMAPLEKLVREVYSHDPAARFTCKGEGSRDALTMARMQKAMAIVQFKLEGQAIARNPHFEMEDRDLLGRIDSSAGTVEIDGTSYPLLDSYLPTIDSDSPNTLSPEEEACMNRLRESFVQSPTLWNHMRWLADRGCTYLRRDHALLFHGCMPVDERGEPLALEIDGRPLKGRALFDAINRYIAAAFRQPEATQLDLFWYLWGGARSPLFGKDKMATFETYFVEDKETHHETKNPYFSMIHEVPFCDRVIQEFGMDPATTLIVNGHVPVKIEKGESPLKRSGKAVTIDGAFSEAYGDRGYTLVMEADRTYLAQHHHFESASDAIANGTDIIPSVQEIVRFPRTRLVRDTERGDELAGLAHLLELLLRAYRERVIMEG